MSLPCVVCRKELKSAIIPLIQSVEPNNQPSEGTTFTSHGQYGSTVWDDFTSQFLELNICDDCVRTLAKDSLILVGHVFQQKTIEYTTWNPDNEI